MTTAPPRDLHEPGVGFVPADRHRFGLVLSFPITDNIVLNDYHNTPYARAWSATTRRSGRVAIECVDRVRRPHALDPRHRRHAFGGNQQKVVVAREFGRDLKLLVLDQPTRGLDVGSIEFIHRETIKRGPPAPRSS